MFWKHFAFYNFLAVAGGNPSLIWLARTCQMSQFHTEKYVTLYLELKLNCKSYTQLTLERILRSPGHFYFSHLQQKSPTSNSLLSYIYLEPHPSADHWGSLKYIHHSSLYCLWPVSILLTMPGPLMEHRLKRKLWSSLLCPDLYWLHLKLEHGVSRNSFSGHLAC